LAEIKWAERIIKEIIGVQPKYLRPPYGNVDDRVRVIAQAADYQILHWNLNSDNWKLNSQSSTERITVFATINNLRVAMEKGAATGTGKLASENHKKLNGFITLEHDLTPDAIKQFPQLIKMIRQVNYQIQMMSQCLQENSAHHDDPHATQACAVSTSGGVPSSRLALLRIDEQLLICITTILLVSRKLVQHHI
jgi:hypothetical protein